MKIRIQTISTWNIIATVMVAIVFTMISRQGAETFRMYQTKTEQYILCENAAREIQEGSDYLTEQVRLYVMTGRAEYLDSYVHEINVTKRRETALDELNTYFNGTSIFASLQEAFESSKELTESEYYAMRLVLETTGQSETTWPEELKNVTLTEKDRLLQESEKVTVAQQIVTGSQYLDTKTKIKDDISSGISELQNDAENKQKESLAVFSGIYQQVELGIIPLVILMLGICIIIRKLIAGPLCRYNECIQNGVALPVAGVAELQNLAETYNRVCMENRETQKQLQYQAEHDALTGLLNRGSFEKIMLDYRERKEPFALILVDVDCFKRINDTYGHTIGDTILKKVAYLLKNEFRNIDFACRVGGDEFAVIMVDVTYDQKNTISDRIAEVNKKLTDQDDGMPAISLSVGVAFSDRENGETNIFKDADKILYYVKEHGKNGCAFFDAGITDTK